MVFDVRLGSGQESRSLVFNWKVTDKNLTHESIILEYAKEQSASKWEEIKGLIIGATVLAEADTRYFEANEMPKAWLWAKGAKHAEDIPVRQIYGGGIWKDYQEEFNL